jgi:hypothetical protein
VVGRPGLGKREAIARSSARTAFSLPIVEGRGWPSILREHGSVIRNKEANL